MNQSRRLIMKHLFLILCMLLVSSSLLAQEKVKGEIQFGFATPTGDFAEDDKSTAIFGGSGYASDGFYLGVNTLKSLSTQGLSWTLSLGTSSNKVSQDYQDYFFDALYDELTGTVGPLYEFSIDYPHYVNIPLMAGLHFEKPIAKHLNMFGVFGLGFNMLKLGELDIRVNGDYETCTFDPSIKTAFKIGGGVCIKDKFTVNLTYMLLGSHKVKYHVSYPTGSDDLNFDKSLPVSTLNLTLGLRIIK
jgi:hypothetical protein